MVVEAARDAMLDMGFTKALVDRMSRDALLRLAVRLAHPRLLLPHLVAYLSASSSSPPPDKRPVDRVVFPDGTVIERPMTWRETWRPRRKREDY